MAEVKFDDLTRAQRALLLCWTPKESVFVDHVDCPTSLEEEKTVMRELAELGLFVIEDHDDPEHGPMRRLYVTRAGRDLVAARHPAPTDPEA